jgi:hypothetical protein
MRLDNKLNLVVEVEADDGSTFYVHSTPISREVFEKYFLIIGKTFSSLISEGLSFVSGPRVAAMMLKKIAMDQGVWEGRDGIEMGLMAEIRRLSNVVMPSDKGWQTFPFQDVIDKKMMNQSDIDEVEGLICFFICVSAMSRKTELPPVLERMRLWGSQITSLNFMEFVGSLQTSTDAPTFIDSEKTSSVAY